MTDDFDAPMRGPVRKIRVPKVMPADRVEPRPVRPGEFICADHKAPDGFWSTPFGWIAKEPNTPVDEAFAYAVVKTVGIDRFVMAHHDYDLLVKWCASRVSGDWRRDYQIRPCNLLILRQDAPEPPGDHSRR